MGTTTIVPILDGNTINCTYFRDIFAGEDVSPIDLVVYVKHKYATSFGSIKEIVLETFTIPSKYLRTTGLAYLSNIEQTVEFNIINLRYLSDIFIEIHEIRDSIPIVTVQALNKGDDVTVEPLVNNPEKDIENDENIPEVLPDIDISSPQQDFNPVIFDSNNESLVYTQISRRIYLDGDIFKFQDYNEKTNRIFVENSIINMLPNPEFASTTHMPSSWIIDAPGIIVNSQLLDADIINTKKWQLHITNPNLFSAFNTVTISIDQPQNLISGLTALTFSCYYKVNSTSTQIPFNTFHIRIRFFMNAVEIGNELISSTVSANQNVWEQVEATIQGSQIRAGANKYSVELEIADIDTTDLFQLELYLPQLEPIPFATTRTLDSRIQDGYLTPNVALKLPFYIAVDTLHLYGYGRGLFSTTSLLKNGFEFLVSSDRLFFKLYDTAGNLIINISSAVFTVLENVKMRYGIWIDTNVIEFYLNDILLSTHATTLNISQVGNFNVGALERANSAINSELLRCKILTFKPT